MKKDITVELGSLKLHGNVLDISTRGNNIISEIVNITYTKNEAESLEKEYIVWDNINISSKDSFYDYACSFFSLGFIRGKRNLNKRLKELKRVLKKDGKLFIWDLHIPSTTLFGDFNVIAKLPDGREKRLNLRVKLNPFRVKFVDMLKLLENNGYKIIISTISNNKYYIEAVNIKEEKNEDGSGGP